MVRPSLLTRTSPTSVSLTSTVALAPPPPDWVVDVSAPARDPAAVVADPADVFDDDESSPQAAASKTMRASTPARNHFDRICAPLVGIVGEYGRRVTRVHRVELVPSSARIPW